MYVYIQCITIAIDADNAAIGRIADYNSAPARHVGIAPRRLTDGLAYLAVCSTSSFFLSNLSHINSPEFPY